MRMTPIVIKGITFSRPGKNYVFMDADGRSPGTLGTQPTDNGNTLCYVGDDLIEFKKTCRNWVRRHDAREQRT
jgi:hypothetical protein